MAPTPKLPSQRARTNKPKSDWTSPAAGGWQHEVPEVPDGLMSASAKTWELWFSSWWAACWDESDVPQVILAIKLYDSVQRGETKDMTKFQTLADSLGITPKGRASLRWLPPKGEAAPTAAETEAADELVTRREARAKKLA